MARTDPGQYNFNGGELTPLLEGRPDLDQYYIGCRTLLNMVATPWGPAIRRPGTRFVVETKDSANIARLFRFRFSTVQAYVLEFGGASTGYIRFYMNRGRIVVAATDAAITNGAFTSGITGWTDNSGSGSGISHDSGNGRMNLTSNGTTEAVAEQSVTTTATGVAHVLAFRVLGVAGDAVGLQIGTSSGGDEIFANKSYAVGWHVVEFTPGASPFYVQFNQTAGKTVQLDDVSLLDDQPLEIGSVYLSANLGLIKYAQSQDEFYLTHPDLPQHKLRRFGHSSWSLEEMEFEDGPYLPENTTDTTMTPSAVSGLAITITASSTEGVNGGDGFRTTDVGRLIRLKYTNWGWARITGWTSSTVVTAHVVIGFGATTAVTAWRLGAWSGTSGYPRSVTFHEGRLSFSGPSIAAPTRIDSSKSGDFQSFEPGTEDDSALSFNIDSDEVNEPLWMVSSKVLLCGSPGGEAKVGSESASSALTPTNVQAKFETRHGCADVMPVPVSNAVLFLQQHNRKVRELSFSFEVDGYRAPDMTIRAEHISKTGICEMVFQPEPWSVVWGCRADGLLIGMTYERDEKVIAWHRHPLGGTDVVVESLAVIPGTGQDEVWLLVRRTINGATRRYIEILEAPLDDEGDQEDAFYVDCGLTYDGAATTVISGLDHLEGETVSILADGAAHSEKTVSGGSVTLDREASVVQVGLGYTWRVRPQRIEAGSRTGTAQGKKKRISEITIRLYRSLGVRVGGSNGVDEIPFRDVTDDMDTAIPLFSGDKKISFNGGWDTDAFITIEGDQPFPVTLQAVFPKMITEDG